VTLEGLVKAQNQSEVLRLNYWRVIPNKPSSSAGKNGCRAVHV